MPAKEDNVGPGDGVFDRIEVLFRLLRFRERLSGQPRSIQRKARYRAIGVCSEASEGGVFGFLK
jgi:hypothetical protein